MSKSVLLTTVIIRSLISSLASVSDVKEARNVFFGIVKMSDIVPEKHSDVFAQIVLRKLYDKTGKGYKGVVNEVTKRLDTIRYTEKIIKLGGIPVREFFLHKQGMTDTVDFDNHSGFEEKSGCGNWLSSGNASFEETVKMYRRKRTKIRWDYTFTVETKKAGKEEHHIFIETTYAQFFDFLADFKKGFDTWWKENSRSGDSGLYVWELQTINTSKTKADYLETWSEWCENHKNK